MISQNYFASAHYILTHFLKLNFLIIVSKVINKFKSKFEKSLIPD